MIVVTITDELRNIITYNFESIVLHLHIKHSPYVYTAELARTLCFDCWKFFCRFLYAGNKVEKFTLFHTVFREFFKAGHKVTLCSSREKCGRLWNWAYIY